MEVHGVAPERYGWLFGMNALGLVGAVAGTLVGALHASTALPMAAVIGLCGTTGWLAYRLGVAPVAPAPTSTS